MLLIRKTGRTVQVYFPPLQDLGKIAERSLRSLLRVAHERELNGLRHIEVPNGGLFLDIGANRGAATRSMRAICPHARIYGFEPNPLMAERIAHLYAAPNALHLVALSKQEGEFPLYVPVYRRLEFDGLASLSEAEARRWLNGSTIFGFDPGQLTIHRIDCRVTTLDQLGLAPFFVKIDVQGFEQEVIEGSLKTIESSRPIIFAESEVLDIAEVLRLLSPWDYDVWRFDKTFRRGEISQSNVYLVPKEKARLIRAA